MTRERRTSYRMVLAQALARAMVLASGQRLSLRGLNAAGGALSVGPGGPLSWQEPAHATLRFELAGYDTFDAEVGFLGPAAASEGGDLVAFRFQAPSDRALATLSAFLCRQHARAGRRIENLLAGRGPTLSIDGLAPSRRNRGQSCSSWLLVRHHLEDQHGPIFLHLPSAGLTVALDEVRLVAGEEGGLLLASLEAARAQTLDESEEYLFFWADELAVTWFRSRIRRRGPSGLGIAVPPVLFQGGFRDSRRVIPPWSEPVTATIENPHLHGESISRRVCELAGHGFAVEFVPARDRLFPGQPLHHVYLHLPSGTVDLACVLRSCREVARPESQSQTMVGGFEICDFHSSRDLDRWMRSLIPCLFPQARIGDQALVPAAWARLEQSGYLALIHPAEAARLRGPFLDDWTRQAGHPGLRARFVLSHRDGVPVGVTAANLVYPKTCLVHSGGIDKAAQGSGQVIDLYAATFLLARSMGEYCLSFFDVRHPANAVLFERFIQHYSAPGDSVFDRVAVYKWQARGHDGTPPARPSEPGLGADIDIVSAAASADLVHVLWEAQQKALGPMELDAYGWSPDGQTMRLFSERCAADGYARHRQLFFALRGGVPRAALVAETGSEGMNVFSLLNCCNVVMLDCPPEERRAVLGRLLARAVAYYRESGKQACLFLGPPDGGERGLLEGAGFTFLADGWRWLAPRRVIPAYIAFLNDLAALRRAQELASAATAIHASFEVRDPGGSPC